MYKQNVPLIATAIITLCLLSFPISSDAFEIESLWSDYGPVAYDYGNDDIAFTVKTDVPYSGIDWYIDFYDGEGFQYQETEDGDGVRKYDDFSHHDLSGTLTEQKYTVKACAFLYGEDATYFSDSKTYDLFVFKPMTESQTEREKSDVLATVFSDISGSLTLYRQYYDGSNISMECSGYVWNHRNNDVRIKMGGVFRHEILNKDLDELEYPLPQLWVEPGNTYGPHSSSDRPEGPFSFPCSWIGETETWESSAYLRITLEDGTNYDSYHIRSDVSFKQTFNLNADNFSNGYE